MSSRVSSVLSGAGLVISLMVLWELVVDLGGVPRYVVPSPIAVLEHMASDSLKLCRHAWATAAAILLAFALASCSGFLLGALCGEVGFLRKIVEPMIVIVQVTPKVALAPLFLLWVGTGLKSVVVVSALIAFLPVYLATINGLARYPTELAIQARLVGMPRGRELLLQKVPLAAPFLWAGMQNAILLAGVGVVVGEFILGSRGLGYLVLEHSARFNPEGAFGAVLLVSIISGGMYGVVILASGRVLSKLGLVSSQGDDSA